MTELHALVPAAGLGARMGDSMPKQYLPLAGQPMIAHALNTLCASPEITTVFVVLAPDDTLFHSYDWSRFGDKLQPLFCGTACWLRKLRRMTGCWCMMRRVPA
jgi:2-C-methyl-D-erythritol 4-phosphate cytidylyltransferase